MCISDRTGDASCLDNWGKARDSNYARLRKSNRVLVIAPVTAWNPFLCVGKLKTCLQCNGDEPHGGFLAPKKLFPPNLRVQPMGDSSVSKSNVMAKTGHESLCGRFW